jgi:hypothetical protein
MAAGQGRDPEPDPHTLGLKAWHFIKSSHAIVGPNTVVKIPPESHKMDWEVELALVIGKKSKNLTAENALDAVVLLRLARTQELRWFVPDRPVDGAGARYRRRTKPRHQAFR